jgi:hypothetical protein
MRKRRKIDEQSLTNRYGIASQVLRSRPCTRKLNRYIIAAQSILNLCAITAESMSNFCAIAM